MACVSLSSWNMLDPVPVRISHKRITVHMVSLSRVYAKPWHEDFLKKIWGNHHDLLHTYSACVSNAQYCSSTLFDYYVILIYRICLKEITRRYRTCSIHRITELQLVSIAITWSIKTGNGNCNVKWSLHEVVIQQLIVSFTSLSRETQWMYCFNKPNKATPNSHGHLLPNTIMVQ